MNQFVPKFMVFLLIQQCIASKRVGPKLRNTLYFKNNIFGRCPTWLDPTFLTYNNTNESQIYGRASMSSPIYSTIDNLTMEELENKVIASLDYVYQVMFTHV